jgi:hypothetical protein
MYDCSGVSKRRTLRIVGRVSDLLTIFEHLRIEAVKSHRRGGFLDFEGVTVEISMREKLDR